MKTKSIYGLQNTPLSAAILVSIHEPHLPYFDKLWTSGSENERYFSGTNLSEKQEEDYYKQDRIPFPNAITADKLTRIISSERNSRSSAKAEATKPDSEIKAELITLRFKKVERDSDMEYGESDDFASGVAVKYGVRKVIVDTDRMGNDVIKTDSIDYKDVIWDSNAKKYSKEDGSFMAEHKLVFRRDMAKDYGKEVADSISISNMHFGNQPKTYWGVADQKGNRDSDLVPKVEHYQKVLRDVFYVIWNGEIVAREGSKAEAEKTLRMLKIPYLTEGVEMPKADVVRRNEEGFDMYVFSNNVVLEYEQTDLEYFPYSIYQAFNFKDIIWCMTDILKPKNKFMDKLMSQVDYAFGHDLKDAAEIVEPWLAQGVTLEEALRMYKEGIPVPVIKPGTLNRLPHKGANPQWLSVYEILKQDIVEYTGGALFAGTQTGGSREAKETVAMRLKQQELVATLFIDNHRRFKKQLFKIVLSFLKKYDTEEQVIKTEGANLSPEMLQMLQQNQIYSPSQYSPGTGYMKLNSPGIPMSFYNDAEVEVIITDAELSPTAREQRLQELERYNMLSPGSVTPDIFLEYSDMSYSLKQKIINNQQKQLEMQMAMMQKQDMKDQEELNIKKAQVLVSDKGNQVGEAKDEVKKKLTTNRQTNK